MAILYPSARMSYQFGLDYNIFVSSCLKNLLESRHLYQKVSINHAELQIKLLDHVNVGERQDFITATDKFAAEMLIANEKQVMVGVNLARCLIVGNVKLFCSSCKSREAFKPIWFHEITSSLPPKDISQKIKAGIGDDFQLFCLAYECQICVGEPLVFLVKRQGVELSIEGRSPMEHIELPNYIPKDEKKWFRDAVISFQSNKVLAALFYLRTFIEQFGRRKTGLLTERKTGDEIMDAYADILPPKLRDTMPSLKEWYDKLSEALHGVKEDSQLFEDARKEIERHFDIRRVFKLDSTENSPLD